MINVECPSCQASYDLDERRIPQKGMNMRCPKCSARFVVAKDGSVSEAPAAPTPSLRPPVPSTAMPAPPAPPTPPTPPTPPKVVPPAVPPPAPGVQRPKPAGVFAAASKEAVSPPPAAPSVVGEPSAKRAPIAPAFQPKPRVPEAISPPAPPPVAAAAIPTPVGQVQVLDTGAPSRRVSQPTVVGMGPASVPEFPVAQERAPETLHDRPTPVVDVADLPALKVPKPAPSKAVPLAPPFPGPAPSRSDTQPTAQVNATEIDLPAIKRPKLDPDFGHVDLPALKSKASEADFGDVLIDLPAVKQREPDRVAGHLDLPAVKSSANEVNFGDVLVDLPAVRPLTPDPSFGRMDLPQARTHAVPKAKTVAFDSLDLGGPDQDLVTSGGEADLTWEPKTSDETEAWRAPTPPAPGPLSHVEKASESLESLGTAATLFGMTSPAASAAPNAPAWRNEASFGDIDLGDDPGAVPVLSLSPGSGPGAAAIAEPLPLPEPAVDPTRPEPSPVRAAAAPPSPAERHSEGMEFGIDSEDNRAFSLPPEALRRAREGDAQVSKATRGSRALRVVGAVLSLLLLLGGGGIGLGMFTPYGYFGIYYVEQFLPEAGTPAQAREFIEHAERIAKSDTYGDVQRSLNILGAARGRIGLSRALLSRSVVHDSLAVLRFGEVPGSEAHTAAMLQRLDERGGLAPGMMLARAANNARHKQWGVATQQMQIAQREAPSDAYASLLAGEIALAQAEGKAAHAAFAKAAQQGAGARAQWGLARAAELLQDVPALASAISETLKLSPLHAEARIAQARLQWQADHNTEKLSQALAMALGKVPVDGQYLWLSKPARATGNTVLGYAEEVANHLHLAREAYDAALAADPNDMEALLGAGRVMLRDRRYRDALARFEAAANASNKEHDPAMLSGRLASTEAKLGIGRSLLALEQAPEAARRLAELATAFPKDGEIARVYGQVQEALGDYVRAEQEYRRAIELLPATFDGYLALSQLFSRTNQPDRASEVLSEAAKHVQESAQMRRTQGQAELARNRLEDAEREFRRALELDAADLEARFFLGQTLRKAGRLAEARTQVLRVGQADETFPGLAMEQGLQLEAEGKYAEAIARYRDGLGHDAADLQLLLRLGAAQVEAGQLDAADETLRKVRKEMPNSAEGEYFTGRIAFGRGRTPDALTHFDRALALDGSQGEFHLYAARATLDMGNLGRALEEANLAIEREPSLGDAYWVRGSVRLRMGAVQDALNDFQVALKLNPGRADAHAGMGDAFEQMGQLPQAGEAYATAAAKLPERGDWWVHLAQVRQDAGHRSEAEQALKRALELDKDKSATADIPPWLVEAYRMMGDLARIGGQKKAAIDAYQRYLQLAPDGHVDRKTVEAQLARRNVTQVIE